MIWLDEHERAVYIGETAQESYERRMEWRRSDVERAQRDIAFARAFNRGKKRVGCVPVYSEHASEASIQQAVRRLNFASHGTR